MSEREFIRKFINERVIEEKRNSCLVVALQDARKLTGRHPQTGFQSNIILSNVNEKVMNEKIIYDSNSFLGLIGYLILMDLIGSLFKQKENENGICIALEKFSKNLNKEERFVIKALRNSLAHNYSLINIPQKAKTPDKQQSKDKKELHKFELIYEDTDFIISVPLESDRWIRDDFKNKLDVSNTKIGVRKLIDEFENVYGNLKEDYDNDNVTLTLGLEELKARFTTIN
jgi:hypothetical protein